MKKVLPEIIGASGLIEKLYEKFSTARKIKREQKIFERTLLYLYHFGQQPGSKAHMVYGIRAATEEELDTVPDLSRLDRFNAISEGERRGLIMHCHSFDHNEWALTREGLMYVQALLDEMKEN